MISVASYYLGMVDHSLAIRNRAVAIKINRNHS